MSVKTITKFMAALIVLGLLTGCALGDADLAWQKINNENAMLVDVRSMEEYDHGHVPGAKLIPLDQVEARLSEFGTDKSAPIVFYCKRGVRADRAKEILVENGFTNVTNGGGYDDMMDAKP